MTEYKRKNVWENLSQDQEKELESLSKDYMDFLDKGKTERLAAKEIVNLAKKAGYVDLEEKIKSGKIKTGDKIYAVNKNKAVAMFHIGSEDLSDGLAIVGGHIDSPRLDLKPVPLTEENGLAYLKTHYYGGVKKYNWTNMPLALHGVVFTKNGEKVDISIGDKDDEPVFFISELLIHLSRQLMEKSAKEVITGEQLSIIVGNRPLLDEKENPVKKNILKILNEKYGIEEEDFITAELEVVPAGKAREVGFDKSMIASHGHDDRVCSYAALRALLDIKESKKTLVGLFVDKEEIGSVGATGMTSQFFENTLLEIMNLKEEFDLIKFKRALRNSKVLSADVTLAEDPNFKDATESQNSAQISHGVALTKYTGSGGKGGSNDADAEYLSQVRLAFNKDEVIFQTGELGKVDQGGGGTIAYILAEYGMDVVDCGTPVISMHAPIELISKADFYSTFTAYRAFYKNIWQEF